MQNVNENTRIADDSVKDTLTITAHEVVWLCAVGHLVVNGLFVDD